MFSFTTIRSRSGFTLIEMIVTIFIIGLFLSITLPSLPDITGYRLKSSARRLGNIMKYVRNRAVIDKKTLRMTFNLDSNSYRVEKEENGQIEEFLSSFNVNGTLPDSIYLDEVVVAQKSVQEGSITARFSPQGYVEKISIYISDGGEDKMTLFVYSATGRVKIHQGYVERESFKN